jgi:hypothetical protein
MKNWKYYEQIAHYYSSYFSAIEQNRSIEMAIATTFEDYFFYPKEDNLVSNMITIVLDIKIQISLLKKVNKTSVDLFKTQLSLMEDDLLSNELEPNEQEHLTETIEEIKYKLKTIEITENPI